MVDLHLHPADIIQDYKEITHLVQGMDIVMTKEMPLPVDVLPSFSSVKLIQEAGVSSWMPVLLSLIGICIQ